MLKSTQTNKYETACFIQEAPTINEIAPGELKILKTIDGFPYAKFNATVQTYGCCNRMKRCYDMNNVASVVRGDERIQTLKRNNQWRGEWNHPNPDKKNETLSDIRMTIPEPTRTSHFLNNDVFRDNRMICEITTHPKTECGKAYSSEIIDLHAIPSYSVRILGVAIPNAGIGMPNIRVSKFITADAVDFPSHHAAEADIKRICESYSSVTFLRELAKYCTEQDETMQIICESFMISPEEIMGIKNESIIIEQADTSKMIIPLKGDIRREAMSILTQYNRK